LSTAEAEYRAAALCTKEVLWIRRLLAELGFAQTSPTIILEDNRACIKMIENPMVSERNKHIEMDVHFIRDHYTMENIKPIYVSTQEQKADLLTKNLPRPLFEQFTQDILDTR
jgi:hypothetical protein